MLSNLEWPDSKQKKIYILYNRTKCRKHSVLLTVEMDMQGRERCYKASITMTHINRNNNDENCNKVAPRAENEVSFSSLPPREEDGEVEI